jgi:uncharacterized membrane protein
MSIEQGKNLAGVGALLLVIGTFVPFLGIVGIILVLVGLKDLSEAFNDSSIFQNALYALVFGIIGIAAAAFIVMSLIFGVALFGAAIGPSGSLTGGILGAIAGIFVALAVAFVFLILEAIYFRKAFDTLASKTHISTFSTAGTLLFIGAILTIILVGLLLILVAWILATVAFFSIQMPAQSQVSQQPSQT